MGMYFFSFFSFCEHVCVCFFMWCCLYSFTFTICPTVLSVHFFVVVRFFFFSIVFSAGYHWWICFLVWLHSSFFLIPFFSFLLLINFFISNNFFYYYFISISLFYFIFLSFFLFFSFFFWAGWLTGVWGSSRVSGLCLWGGRAEFRTLVHQRPRSSK